MQTSISGQTPPRSNAASLLRVLIASYFVAVGLGLIPGTDFTQLTGLIAEPQVASVLTAIVVFALSYMVMVGYRTRLAALVLALFTFFAAFVGYVGPSGTGDLGAFWRDLALVAALLLTYPTRLWREDRKRIKDKGPRRPHRPDPASGADRRDPSRPAPRKAEVTEISKVRRQKSVVATRPTDLHAPLTSDEIENIFHDYATSR